VGYDVTSDENNLTGLGLRVHYDSSKLGFVQVSDFIDKDNILSGTFSEPDSGDFDNNPITDRFISLAWASVNGDWPDVSLPAKLLSMTFLWLITLPCKVQNTQPLASLNQVIPRGMIFPLRIIN